MKARTALLLLVLLAGQAVAQSGLRLPQQGEPGLDPTFARGWLAPDYDRFGFALYNWREAVGFAPGQRMNWSYTLNNRSSLTMSVGELEEQRQLSLYGRYSLTADWALSAETLSRDASGLFRLQDFRIGVQRRF
ncbi:MAG TPA: hypothetical protein VGX52_11745 [Burkholderiales bacterium]|nr:hypothetical protein [Burkholderiales bacterium]